MFCSSFYRVHYKCIDIRCVLHIPLAIVRVLFNINVFRVKLTENTHILEVLRGVCDGG